MFQLIRACFEVTTLYIASDLSFSFLKAVWVMKDEWSYYCEWHFANFDFVYTSPTPPTTTTDSPHPNYSCILLSALPGPAFTPGYSVFGPQEGLHYCPQSLMPKIKCYSQEVRSLYAFPNDFNIIHLIASHDTCKINLKFVRWQRRFNENSNI